MTTNLAPATLQAIARHTRSMLKSVKRGRRNTFELACALAAAKIVVATLEKAAAEVGLPEDVLVAGDELSRDAARVMDLVRWR